MLLQIETHSMEVEDDLSGQVSEFKIFSESCSDRFSDSLILVQKQIRRIETENPNFITMNQMLVIFLKREIAEECRKLDKP